MGAAHAQFELGAKGGINFADVSNMSGSNRVSGYLGLFAHKTLDPHWCIQPELLYSGQGQKFPLGNDEHTLALDYIQIPVMVQYFPIKQLYVEFGPQLAFLTSAKVKMSDGSKVEIDDHYSAADFSINIGLGYMATKNSASMHDTLQAQPILPPMTIPFDTTGLDKLGCPIDLNKELGSFTQRREGFAPLLETFLFIRPNP